MTRQFVDHVAVWRAVGGEPLPLNIPERLKAVHYLVARGRSVRDIADVLHLAPRTVARLCAKPGDDDPIDLWPVDLWPSPWVGAP